MTTKNFVAKKLSFCAREDVGYLFFQLFFQLSHASTASRSAWPCSSARRPSSSAWSVRRRRQRSPGWRMTSLWCSTTEWRLCRLGCLRSPTSGCRIAASSGATYRTRTRAGWAESPISRSTWTRVKFSNNKYLDSDMVVDSVTSKKSPNVYKSCTKIIYTCGQLGQNDCCHRRWKVAQSPINCQSGHTDGLQQNWSLSVTRLGYIGKV